MKSLAPIFALILMSTVGFAVLASDGKGTSDGSRMLFTTHSSSGNSYSICGGYEIDVSRGAPTPKESCMGGAGGSCIGEVRIVAPGEVRKDKVLVNYEHDLSSPGLYSVHASRTLSYGPPTESWRGANEMEVKIVTEFEIQVDIGDDETLVPMFQPCVADLSSKDEERQREATRVIGSLAPPFLEDTIISM